MVDIKKDYSDVVSCIRTIETEFIKNLEILSEVGLVLQDGVHLAQSHHLRVICINELWEQYKISIINSRPQIYSLFTSKRTLT